LWRGYGVGVVFRQLLREKLLSIAKEKILPESTVFTDKLTGYGGLLEAAGVTHKRINHSEKVYVMGDTHANDGFWSLVKGGIGGVYHQVFKKYLQTFLDEYSFRYNRRDQGKLIFNAFLERIAERVSQPDVRSWNKRRVMGRIFCLTAESGKGLRSRSFFLLARVGFGVWTSKPYDNMHSPRGKG
jgi:transposase-like protein